MVEAKGQILSHIINDVVETIPKSSASHWESHISKDLVEAKGQLLGHIVIDIVETAATKNQRHRMSKSIAILVLAFGEQMLKKL